MIAWSRGTRLGLLTLTEEDGALTRLLFGGDAAAQARL